MSPIDKLAQLFEKFPGIGPKQARRFVQHLLVAPPSTREELAAQVRMLGAQTTQCKTCFRWFSKDAKAAQCTQCADPARDQKLLFVIEKDADIENVERSGYRGLYFVLGGVIPLGAAEPTEHIRLRELERRVAAGGLSEVILGLSATSEGDHTRQILAEKLQAASVKISSLGRGLSTGSELEYADPDTISAALNSRN